MTAKPLIRIVDDDEALTPSSAMLLEAMGWDVAVWHSGGAFLDEADLMRPGCLVLDVRMPGLTGLDVQAELERRGSNLPILFLSAHGSIQMAVHVMRHGAVDFLEKPVEPMTLVQRVAQCVTASLSAKADDAAADEVRRRFDRLTPREREVIDGVLKNAPNKIIARTLGIELSTVKMHRANAFAKLGVHSPGELLKMAYEAGIGFVRSVCGRKFRYTGILNGFFDHSPCFAVRSSLRSCKPPSWVRRAALASLRVRPPPDTMLGLRR